MKNGLAIGIVTYHPGPGFYDRVELVANLGVPVYVFDNSPVSTDVSRLLSRQDGEVTYITAGENAGLGFGLSVICATARAHSHDNVLFFDQDTGFTSATIEYALDFAARRAPALGASHTAVVFQAPQRSGFDHEVRDVLLAISSGSLFFLANLERIGWHNRSYFVDGVDYEFCLRSRAKGFRIGTCAGAPGFDHMSEQPDVTRAVIGLRLRLRKYRAARILDSLSAYVRLTAYSLRRVDLHATLTIVRSMAIFVLGQILARLPLGRVDQ
jgi:rhamnosyltransferase